MQCKPQVWGVSIGDGEYGAPTIPAPPWVLGAHKTFIGVPVFYLVYRSGTYLTSKGAKTSSLNGEHPPSQPEGGRFSGTHHAYVFLGLIYAPHNINRANGRVLRVEWR